MDDLNAEIERRQAIADAATPGPWFAHLSMHGDPRVVTDTQRPSFSLVAIVDTGAPDYGRDNNTFIAQARTGYPQCLEALKLAVAALEQIDTNEWGHVTADGQDNDVAIALEATAARALEAIKRALEGK